MADATQLLYLEPDDEITSVVRRLREADADRLVLVASGRSKATTSAVALRLLAQVAAEEHREIAIVADAAGRALAAEAGIPAFASVADANATDAVPLEPAPAQRAPIHVVRGEPEPAAPTTPAAELAPAAQVEPVSGMEETQAVAVQRPAHYPVPRAEAPPARPRASPRPGQQSVRRAAWVLPAVVLMLFGGAGVALGALLPAATVTIRPQAVPVGPLTYSVRPQVHAGDGTELTSTQSGEATGHRKRRTPATGEVLLINYSGSAVPVPAGTPVSARKGEIVFRTTQDVTVPESFFAFVGTAIAPIEAVDSGPEGNVDALAIDTIEDRDIDRALRGPGPNDRRIRNDNPTGGGAEEALLVVKESDVKAVTDAIRADLRRQLADHRTEMGEERIYPSQGIPRIRIEVPGDLEGHTSTEPFTFELTGTLQDDQAYVLVADAREEAAAAILDDASAAPGGTTIDPDTIEVQISGASLEGDAVVAQAAVSARAVPQFDASAIPGQIAGSTADEARQRLSSIGDVDVILWPFWVDRVPNLGWRVSVDVQSVEPVSE
ncbi:MAG TPA: hypothetical protein VFK61_00685 [Candidatus Limnocylindria bacterium]|nr:hypothetical protein [Candidatus Limnocylindria bacterium]